MRAYAHLVLCFALGCASTTGGSAAAPPPLETGEWNDVDADLVARGIIEEALKSRFVEEWQQGHADKKPTLRLYPIRNRTTAYINHRFFTKQLEQALVRAGKLAVVAAAEERAHTSDGELEDVREQADDQAQGRHDADVDLVLNGWIVSQEEQDAAVTVRSYLTSVEILDVATEKKVWIGQKRIRKQIAR